MARRTFNHSTRVIEMKAAKVQAVAFTAFKCRRNQFDLVGLCSLLVVITAI
jgi:hypothetical protein